MTRSDKCSQMDMVTSRLKFWICLFGVFALLATIDRSDARAFLPKQASPDQPFSLKHKEFARPELQVKSTNVPLADISHKMANSLAYENFKNRHDKKLQAHIDARSGTPANIVASIPLIPGKGRNNRIKHEQLSQALGRTVKDTDAVTVAQVINKFISDNQDVLGLDLTQLGAVKADKVAEHLWQISVPQQVNGVKVRNGRLAATINNGNLVTVGTETWGNAKIDTTPKITADEALSFGFKHVNGRLATDELITAPLLEIIPVAPSGAPAGEQFNGIPGQGYGHRLVWTFAFTRAPDVATWEVVVDASTGEILAFTDKNQYLTEQLTGGVYPLTNTGIAPSLDRFGIMQSGYPMPYADTGLPEPNDFTNSAGLFDYEAGTALTKLLGKYVQIYDLCGTINESGSGSINLGGFNGAHDCVFSGSSSGNTAAARSAFYEVNKTQEMGRGYLPNLPWLKQPLSVKVNLNNNTCNAFWNGISINFFKGGGGCGNTGELAGVFDHEWGHGLDNFLHSGTYSNPSESFADIAAIYRLQSSCAGYGFFGTNALHHFYDRSSVSFAEKCGLTADGTGANTIMSQPGTPSEDFICAENCSGAREVDWDRITSHTPATTNNFVCTQCGYGFYNGPCGREVHCESAVDTQAAWDFVSRDLQSAPFNYDANTAFLVANRIFYLGSGNIGDWHTCSCQSQTSSGCGATNAYMQWLAADDDDGDLTNGTPHMTALYSAFSRHGIACDTPVVANSGCTGAPTIAPVLNIASSNNQISLSWNADASAARYRLFRTEGFAGCDFGKTPIAMVSGVTGYVDFGLANGREYCYTLMSVGAADACFSRASSCVCATPAEGPSGKLQGTVISLVNNLPLKSATVRISKSTGEHVTNKLTDSTGFYQISGLMAGSYKAIFSAYGHLATAAYDFEVIEGNPTVLNGSLNLAATTVVQGVVQDDSGHGWPLYAKIAINTDNGYANTVFTDPVTGSYSVTLYNDTPYTFTVTAEDYKTGIRMVTPALGGATEDFRLKVDFCTAAGYGMSGTGGLLYYQDFEDTNGGFVGGYWDRVQPVAGPGYAHSGGYALGPWQDGLNYWEGYSTSPDIDLSANTGKGSRLSWWQWLEGPIEKITRAEISKDGGTTWTIVDAMSTDLGWNRKSIELDASYSVNTFRIRFYFSGASDLHKGYYVDDISVQKPDGCLPQVGGLVVGNVYSANSGLALNGAAVEDANNNAAGTAPTPEDDALNDGFYTLFLPAGSSTLNATYPDHYGKSKTVSVGLNAVVRQDFALNRFGLLQGVVRSAATGSPINGATVIVAGLGISTTITTGATGMYQTANLPAGTYTVTVSAYGYQLALVSAVVTSGNTATTDVTLNTLPAATVQGRITDGSGHGWPLYAKVSVTAPGFSASTYTDPLTGDYSFNLYQGAAYTMVATLAGYTDGNREITPSSGTVTENIVLVVSSPCSAPGYSASGVLYYQPFEASNGGFSSEQGDWNWLVLSPAHGGSMGIYLRGNIQDSYFVSPDMDLSSSAGQSSVLSWWQKLRTEADYDEASVEISKDGGATWAQVYGPVSGDVHIDWTKVTIQLDPTYAVNNFRIRFHYTADESVTGSGWQIDDLSVEAQQICTPEPGGLVVGNVYLASSGTPLNSATVSDDLGNSATTVPTPNDPNLDDGFYQLFLPAGSSVLTGAYAVYFSEPAAAAVIENSVIRQNIMMFNTGAVQGIVTSFTDGSPISNAVVTYQNNSVTTDASGFFRLDNVNIGVQSVKVCAYSYSCQTVTVPVAGAVTTQNAVLSPASLTTVTGYISDWGHPWRLNAKIDISIPGFTTTVYSDPTNYGYYSVPLYTDNSYTFTVSAPGYEPAAKLVTLPPLSPVVSLSLPAAAPACSVPGYAAGSGIFQSFETTNGGYTIKWTGWEWSSPDAGLGAAHSGGRVWGTNLSRKNFSGPSILTSAPIDLSAGAGQSTTISWWELLDRNFSNDSSKVEVSKDGGVTWAAVYTASLNDLTWRKKSVVLDPSYAVSNLLLRFNSYTYAYSATRNGWVIDDVMITNGTIGTSCQSLAGAIVNGVVSDGQNRGLNGVTVTSSTGAATTTTDYLTGNSVVNAGYYRMFLPTGTTTITASAPGYQSASATLNANSYNYQNLTLPAALIDPLVISTATLPAASTLISYDQTLAATGGKLPYTWRISAGVLPYGITLNSSSGRISGIPVNIGTFTVEVTDADSNKTSKEFAITVDSLVCAAPPFRINRAPGSYYPLLQTAYESGLEGDILEFQSLELSESLLLNREITITLRGGYDCGYNAGANPAVIRGSLTISSGTAIIDNMAIK